jgi:uncharacterized protein YdhG (YjbR/CyaY superfamily)
MATTKTATKATGGSSDVWSDEERAAMKESARERKAASRRDPAAERAEGERDIRDKIATLPEPDRTMAARIHQLVSETVPALMPRTYYGMPAYSKDGKTVCFFKPASKFKERYSTFGFEQAARIDDGQMWPVAFAVIELSPDVEARIVELVKRAAG